ncbi:hypothetical protein C8J57DRAFT_1441278 [Mycena rebaudengoi]|nr:hypothetical protein C8J57DRAFT_1441278 [Mycena rebaudengoi]
MVFKFFKVFFVSPAPKPRPSPLPAASTSAPAAPGDVTPEVVPAAAAAPPPADASGVPDAAAPPPAFGDTPSFLPGQALQTTIANMIEMGFSREEVMRALGAGYNDLDRAVEYLVTSHPELGIPAHLEAEASGAGPAGRGPPAAAAPTGGAPAAAVPAAPAAPGPAPPAAAAAPTGPPNAQLDLAALQNEIQQLQQMSAEDGARMQSLIQQLGAQNPAPAFTQMILHDHRQLEQNLAALMQRLDTGDFDEGEDGPVPPARQVVNVTVTKEESAAIQRLEALGFPRQATLEAYFACDKNEELAANYLFESAFED